VDQDVVLVDDRNEYKLFWKLRNEIHWSVARLSSVCQSICHGCIIVINQYEIGPRLLLITYRKSHIGFQMT